ncbi:MAG: hypothetical protein M1281_11115 [Chloroflexi bacterium]|nr:hypothetical protein [Chloroflexota bacterium]
MVVVPVASYFVMQEILAQNAIQHWFQVPPEILSPWGDPLIFVKIFIALVAVVVIYAILLLVAFTYDKLFGPPHYGPTDSPPSDPGVHRS